MTIKLINPGDGIHIRYGALDGDSLIGFADYRISEANPRDINLVNLYVMKEYRKQGIASSLIKYSGEKFKRLGFRIIFGTVIDGAERVDDAYSVLIHNHFLPVALGGHVLGYYLQDLKNVNLARNADKYGYLYNKVYDYSELSKEMIRKMQVRAEQCGLNLNMKRLPYEACSFFVENGEVKATWLGKRLSDRVIMIEDPAFLDESMKAYSITGLLFVALLYISERLPEDTLVLVRLSNDDFYKGMLEALGEPEYDLAMQQYACLLEVV